MERYAEIKVYRAICSIVHVKTVTLILIVYSPTAVEHYIIMFCMNGKNFKLIIISQINSNNGKVYNKSKRI